MAVNIEVKIPIDNVTAKPLTGPVPILYKITATISVVKFASKIVTNARSNPALIACCGGRPFFISSLILEKINTFASTAIPTVRTIPAIPGNVSVADKLDMIAMRRIKLAVNARLAAKPKDL